MQAYDLADVLAAHAAAGALYHEFVRAPSLSTGLYLLPAGAADPQQPHTEDEVYYVIDGRAQIRVAEEDRAVAAGSVVFVAAGVEHRFHTITADLKILVFFAPARGTHATASA
jgi:mannose-6-phosphate isomerase-like protein (cupin superfamily)